MKIKATLLIILVLMLTSCAATRNSQLPQNTKLSQLEAEQANPVNTIEVLTSKTTLKRGENGVIVIRGTPGITYTISANYKAGNRMLAASQHETAAPDGIVTFRWFVAQGTSPGVYPIEIRGGGELLRTTYSVR